MKNTLDLIQLYVEINENVIKIKRMSPRFIKFTQNLKNIKLQLQKIKFEIPRPRTP